MKNSINFNRSRAQLKCETFLGCINNRSKWESITGFENYVLNYVEAKELREDLVLDSADLYFKGILSLSESFISISKGLYSWATIKLYYSTYYFIKAFLSIKGYGLIRKRNLFLFRAENGESPLCKNTRRYSSDHSGTIKYYQDLFRNSDILLDNEINGKTSYEWLMEKREQVNYKERSFNEPDHSEFWDLISTYDNSAKLSNLIEKYIKDEYIYCFQEDHACLALPIKRMILTSDELKKTFQPILKQNQISLINKILSLSRIKSSISNYL